MNERVKQLEDGIAALLKLFVNPLDAAAHGALIRVVESIETAKKEILNADSEDDMGRFDDA